MATLQLDMFTTLALPTHDHAETYIGTCKVCKATQKRTSDTLTYSGHLHYGKCRNNCSYKGLRVEIDFRKIQGTYNPRIKCGFKCQTATGPVCECSCNGAHHGGRA
jgi:hypothetical protein